MGATANSPKTCYCETCDRWFNPLGITSHRAMHMRRHEDCVIEYTHGDVWLHEFSEQKTDKQQEVSDG